MQFSAFSYLWELEVDKTEGTLAQKPWRELA